MAQLLGEFDALAVDQILSLHIHMVFHNHLLLGTNNPGHSRPPSAGSCTYVVGIHTLK